VLFWGVLLCLGFLISPTGRAQPVEPISIRTPGEGSQVTAPVDVSAVVFPGEDGLIRVTLVDRNRNLLSRQLLRVQAPKDGPIEFSTALAFQIPAETTQAILTIDTQDQVHRPLASRSVTLTLQSDGIARIEDQPPDSTWLTITQPEPGALITESPLVIEGTLKPINSKTIFFELLTERGVAIATKQLAVELPGEPMTFKVALSYAPSLGPRDMRLVIRQPADMIGVDAVLDSLPLQIAP